MFIFKSSFVEEEGFERIEEGVMEKELEDMVVIMVERIF